MNDRSIHKSSMINTCIKDRLIMNPGSIIYEWYNDAKDFTWEIDNRLRIIKTDARYSKIELYSYEDNDINSR